MPVGVILYSAKKWKPYIILGGVNFMLYWKFSALHYINLVIEPS